MKVGGRSGKKIQRKKQQRKIISSIFASHEITSYSSSSFERKHLPPGMFPWPQELRSRPPLNCGGREKGTPRKVDDKFPQLSQAQPSSASLPFLSLLVYNQQYINSKF
jgi:hypothetical protein